MENLFKKVKYDIMKKSLVSIVSLFMIASCQTDGIILENEVSDDVLYASLESINVTKTFIDENNNVLWSDGDQLIAFMRSTLGVKYQIKEQFVGTSTGGFSKINELGNGDDLETGQELDHNIVVYPHSYDVWCMKNDNSTPTQSYKLNLVLPETQIYEKNSFATGALPMVAVSENNKLTFRNICGGIKLQFKGVDKIQSIKLEGLGNEKVAGKSTIVGYANGNAPTITMASTAVNSVLLDCGDGVQLDEEAPTTFIIAVPPIEFASGMKITVTDTDGFSNTLTNSSPNTIKRSSLLTFPIITYKQDCVFEIPEGTMTAYEIISEGGFVEIPITTNQEYQVVIPEHAGEWISIVETKVLRNEIITLNIAKNTTSELRSAEVIIVSTEGATLQTISISQEAEMTLLPTNPDEFTLVDLGLSVKWANYNMGAQTPYEIGTATDWGHEEGKDASYPINMNISDSKYDIVKATLGGDWRLPTAFDFMELEQNCTWTQVEINGITGNLVTGPNGNSIFLHNTKYWTGTAWERRTSNNEYIYGIQWVPTETVIASGSYNRPVQGKVRVIPQPNHTVNDITKNTATVISQIDGYDFDNIDLGLRLRVANEGSIYVSSQSKEGNKYTFNLDNLSNGTTYNIKASYSILGHTINEEDQKIQFRTWDAVDGDGIEAKPIDVGLSVKWASWNIGATCPHDKGIKLPWGGISVNDEARYDLTDIDISGTEYDPATALWGPEWRLPRMEEWNELIRGYYKDYVSNAIGGILLKDEIFLPGSGITNYMSGSYLEGCYFLLYAYCNSGSLLGNTNTIYVRPVYDPTPQLAKVTTNNISSSTVTLSSDVVRIGGANITRKGFVYSKQENPTLDSGSVIEASDDFCIELTNLSDETTYFVKAFATNSFGTSYGDEISFTTKEEASSLLDYIDEYGINHGPGIEIDEVVWAPVNCGYHAEDFKYGKLYQWGRKYGQGYSGDLYDSDRNVVGKYSDAWSPKLLKGPVSLEIGNAEENADFYIYEYIYSINNKHYNWLDVKNDKLWNLGTETEPIKTEYDPCPSNWRVPTGKELRTLMNNYSQGTINDGVNGYWLSGTKPYTEEVPQIFLSFGGKSNCDDYQFKSDLRGWFGIYWASTVNEEGIEYIRLFSIVGIGPGYNGANPVETASIRCVRE